MPKRDTPGTPLPDLLHPTDVAARLAVSRPYVYKLIHDGALTAVPLGPSPRSGRRITRVSYEAYLARIQAEGAKRFGAAS